MDKIEQMKALIEELNNASFHYYEKSEEKISNIEYDKKYDALEKLEKELQTVLSNSPTLHVGYEVVTTLPKEKHEKPMLSLAKTKSKEELKEWLGEQKGLLSWKMDGLTIVLTYQNGKLKKAVTRGNGEIGEVITNNAKMFVNLPGTIPYQEELILRGEAVISYSEFQKINQEIENPEEQYKNPRNLCSGSVRQLNNKITANRNVEIYIFSLVEAKHELFDNSKEKQYAFLKDQGFSVVEYQIVTKETIFDAIELFSKKVKTNNLPSDGLVLTYDDISYGESLGKTAKFPRDSIAFKWKDELAETKLKYIEWSPSRTGLINPVAVFDTVELEGTSVSRASVHNLSILENLQLGTGDQILVYKANMIIPQIAENSSKTNTIVIPDECPACGEKTEIRMVNEARVLYCNNKDCPAKRNKSFALFVSRNALNIDGLSESTLEKLIAKGFIHSFSDIFRLEKHREEMSEMEGFGEKSANNLLAAIENAKHTTIARLLYGLGIANIGVSNAKVIVKKYKNDFEALKNASLEELINLDGVGEVIANAFVSYFTKEKNRKEFDLLCHILTFEEIKESDIPSKLEGKTMVITGSLFQYSDRSAMKEAIERLGGKVTGTVSSKTDYLINNDVNSMSSKNKKAKELKIPILTEEEFMEQFIS